jgi:hypothetical protein
MRIDIVVKAFPGGRSERHGADAKGTALDTAREAGNDEIAQLLIEHGAAE